ncbi:DUF1788 domain-containing protein [uncultured Endozoicomonas sp.]|uniref:DUF1788 domain-containing protein n=1 Tax=uncultured Endozoicomonas sp. TaxID=432652 RepID=UPI002608A699|nr:DUF1788 domain-containing protein [uncultured Endozoicomonas sp.]
MTYDQRSDRDLLDHLVAVISSDRFLKMQGLGNEVPFFICPFDPRKANNIEKIRKNLSSQLLSNGVDILEINLYDLCFDLLNRDDDWSWYVEKEPEIGKEKLLEDMQSILDVEKNIIPAIAERMKAKKFGILILSGVGEVFPIIRSHNLLSNLQSTAKYQPTLMFFPGTYSYSPEKGSSLELFGKLHDDNYYRAFNILNRSA